MTGVVQPSSLSFLRGLGDGTFAREVQMAAADVEIQVLRAMPVG